MACAVGISVLDTIRDEKLMENSHDVGTYFLHGLAKLRDQYEIVGDVRGKGLMIGIEMVEDKESKTPLNGEKMLDIWDATKDAGVLLGKGGFYGNVFRIKPPMCITKENVDKAVAVFEEAVS